MKRYFLFFMAILTSVLTMRLSAQVLDGYAMSTGTDPTKWITLTTDTNVCTTGTSDSRKSDLLNIGFDFVFGGQTYTQFSVNSDGNLRFGSTLTGTSYYTNPFSAANANQNNPKINFLGCDGFMSDSGYVHVELTGTAPERVLVVEFATSTYNTTSRLSILRWQVQLFEGSNNIQVVFASTMPPILPAVTRQVGMCVDANDIILVNANHQARHYTSGLTRTNASETWPDPNRYYLFEIPVCPKPLSFAVDSTTLTEAFISFEADPLSNASWMIEYGPAGFQPGEGTILDNVYSPVTISNLNPMTEYDFHLQGDCGADGLSARQIRSAWTACEYLAFPLYENFDNYEIGAGNSPQCWNALTNYTTSYPYINSISPAASSPNALYFYATTAYYSAITLPEIDTLTTPINTTFLAFNFKKTSATTSTYGDFQVGVMTDPTDISTFTAVKTYLGSQFSTTDWYDIGVSFADYTGYGSYIAIRSTSSGTNYFYIDNVRIFNEGCPQPLNVTTVDRTSNSITIEWTPGGDESNWEVVFVESGADITDAVPGYASEESFTFENLTDDTAYDVYVRANCDDGSTSAWSYKQTIRTRCLPVTELPYTEDFDGYGTGVSVFPSCMERKTNYSTNYPYVNYNSSLGDTALYFYSSTSNYSTAITPAFDLSNYAGLTLNLSFELGKTSANYGRLNVYATPNPLDESSYTLLRSFSSDDLPSTNTFYEFELAYPVIDATELIYFVIKAPEGTSNYVYVDDIVVDVATGCPPPTQPQVVEEAYTTATIQWQPSSFANSYTIELSEAETENWTVVETSFEGTEYTFTGLFPTMSYNARISSNCEETPEEIEYATVSFSTICPRNSVQLGTGTNSYYYFPVDNNYKYSYTQQLYHANELTGLDTIAAIAFDYKSASPMTKKTDVKLWLMPTTETSLSSAFVAFDSTAAVLVYEGDLNMFQGWNEFAFSAPFVYDGTSNLVLIALDNSAQYDGTSYTYNNTTYTSGTSRYFHVDGSYPIVIDSAGTISVNGENKTGTSVSYRVNTRFLSSCLGNDVCLAPNVETPAATAETITLSWLPGLFEENWEIEYKEALVTDWQTVQVTSSPYTIYGLTPSTAYNVRIRSVCDNNENSEWVEFGVQTECLAVTTLPYTENFDNATGSGAGNFISCWKRGTSSTTAYPYTSSTYSRSTPYSLYFFGSSSVYSYAALPRFDESIPMDSLLIEFYLRYSTTYSIEVGIMENPNDYSTFEPIQAVSTASDWILRSVQTDNYTGNGRYIAFRVPATSTSYIYLDDIMVDYLPACEAVASVSVVSVGETEATIMWNDEESSSWEVAVVAAGEELDLNNLQIASEDSYTFENLLSNTVYTAYVRPYCETGSSLWRMVSFRTECSPISVLPYTEDFENYGTGSSAYPYCWDRMQNYSTTNYPYITTTSNVKALYFYTGTATYNIASMHALADDIDVTNLRLTFNCKITNIDATASAFQVGVMDDPSDILTFTPVDTITGTLAGNWEEKVVDFANYQGTGRYIAFRYANTTSATNLYIDDVVLDNIPSCEGVSNIAVSNIATSSVDISWSAGGDETAWEVVVTSDEFDESAAVLVNDSIYTAAGLNSASIYTVYVRPVCAGGYAPWESFVFSTAQIPAALPYSHGFEDDIENDNWTILNSTSVNKWYIGTAAHNGDNSVKSLYISNDNGINNKYTLTSACVVWAYRDFATVAGETYQLSFDWKCFGESSYDYLSVFVGPVASVEAVATSTITPPAGAVRLVNRLNQDSTTYNRFSYIIPEDSVDGVKRLYFMWRQDAGGGKNPPASVDNITIEAGCFQANNLNVSNIMPTTADFTWDANNATSWEVAIAEEGQTPDVYNTTVVSTNEYTFTNLTDATDYVAYVRSLCSDTTYDWVSFAFKTACYPTDTLPYMENFDTYVTGSANPEFVDCWTRSSNYSSTAYYPYFNSSNAVSGSNSLYFYASTSTYSLAAMNAMDASIQMNRLRVSFAARATTLNVNNGFQVGVMTDPTDISTFVPLGVISFDAASTWENKYVDLTDYTGEGRHVALRMANVGGGIFVDNVVLSEISDCDRPVILAVATTEDAATVTISPSFYGTPIGYEYVYGIDGFDPSTGTPVQVNDTVFTITGLASGTHYDLFVRTICDNGETSEWSPASAFFTECDVLVIPYEEDFDIYTTGSSAPFVDCWTRMNSYSTSTNYPYVVSSYSASPSNSLYFYASTSTYSLAVLHPLDSSFAMNNIRASFSVRASSATTAGGLQIGVMTDPTDASTFVPVGTVSVSTLNVWQEKMFDFTSYTGTGRHIALRLANVSGSLYVDDLLLEEIPTCDRPEVTSATSTLTSVTVTITPSTIGTPIGYEYVCGNLGFDPATATPVQESNTTFTITGLSSSTSYDLYVRSICGVGDTSAWSEVYVITTECDLIDLPYSEDFDSYAGTTYSTAGLIPACWDNYSNNTTYPAPHITGSGSYNYPNSGTNALTFTASSAGANAIAILPEFSTSLNHLDLSFYYRMESATYGALAVGYVTDVTDPITSFVSVEAINNTLTITNHEISFTDLTNVPAGARIAFKWTQNGTFYSCGIDDILVEVDSTTLSSCDAPTALAVSNVSQTGATATWTAGGEETAWNVQYKLASASDWGNSINVTAPTYTFTGLTANTAYQVRVQAVCGTSETSDWTAAVEFTTLDETAEFCPAPTGLTATDVQNETITLTWEQEANTANSWEVQYRVQGSETWNSATATAVPYTLTGLTGLTTYEIQVVANCTNGLTSDPSNMITETTTNTGINGYDLESSVNL